MNRFFTEYAGRVALSPRRCVAGNRDDAGNWRVRDRRLAAVLVP